MSDAPDTTPNKDAGLPESVLVIDDDASATAATKKLLVQAGVKDIETEGDGESAWQKLQAKPVDFVILDWKMAPLSGANLLHRIRGHEKLQDTPILVASGYIKKGDFRFAEEYLFTTMLEKPVDGFLLPRRMRDMMKDRRWYDSEKPRIADLVTKVATDGDTALTALKQVLAQSPRPIPIALLAARTFYTKDNMEAAASIIKDLLQKHPTNALALTLQGKILLRQKSYDEALKVLKKAYDASPENPDRLCLLGDANMQMLNVEQGEAYFRQAQRLDPTFEKAKAGIGLAKNLSEYLNSEELGKMPDSYASLLNMVGVSLVRDGRFEDGMEHYKSALNFVDQTVVKARLSFNLGLGYIRWKKPEKATEWLKQSAELGGTEFTKGGEYLTKMNNPGGAKTTGAATTGAVVAIPQGEGEEMLGDIERQGEQKTPATAPAAEATAQAAVTPPAAEATAQAAVTPPAAEATNVTSMKDAQFARVPEEEKKAHTDAADSMFMQIVAMMPKLNIPDPNLFRSTGNNVLKKTHEAFEGMLGNEKVAVFVPLSHRPNTLGKPGNEMILRNEVLIFSRSGSICMRIWPRDSKRKAAGE